MKKKKVYLIIAYMFIVLALTFVIVNTQALAIESNAEGNNVLNTNVNTDKTTFKAKVKYKKFPNSTESNPVIRKEILVGLTKNGVDLGTEYEKKVSTRYDEVELTWDNLEKYTVENGVQKENVYEIKLKTRGLSDKEYYEKQSEYEVEIKSNEITITSNIDFKDFHTTVEFKNFKPGDEKPEFRVQLIAIKGREPYETYAQIGEEYDKTVDAGEKNEVSFEWKNVPVYKVRELLKNHEGSISYTILIKRDDLNKIDKKKYDVKGEGTNFIITKKEKKPLETGEVVDIKDPEFRKLLIASINGYMPRDQKKELDDPIYKHELEKITSLEITFNETDLVGGINVSKIKNLDGIENLINLERVNLKGINNQLIKELSKAKNLKSLYIYDLDNKDKIENEAFKGLSNLEELHIERENKYTNFIGAYQLKNLGFLKHLYNLKDLSIYGSTIVIENLDDIKNSSIKKLSLTVKNISTITPITDNKSIEELKIKMNRNLNFFANGTPEERKNARLDFFVSAISYYIKQKNASREEALRYIKNYMREEGDNVTEEEFEKYINEFLTEEYDLFKIKNLKEILKMKKLKSLTLDAVGLENIDGISELKELEKLFISNNLVSNIDELLKIEKLNELDFDINKIYDGRKLKNLKDKGLLPHVYDENFKSDNIAFIINPKKFTLPDIYNLKGEKFDLLDEKNIVDLPESDGHIWPKNHIDIFNSIKNFIKKNEDGTYSYIYRPYQPLIVSRIYLFPIVTDYNDQDLRKNDSRYVVDKSKIVEFKNEKLKNQIMGILKSENSYYNYVKDEKETDLYEDELKLIKSINISDSLSEIGYGEKEDLSDLSKLSNLENLEIGGISYKDLNFLKDLKNLKVLKVAYFSNEDRLPKFDKDNKIQELNLGNNKLDIENFKENILNNNFKELSIFSMKGLYDKSFIGLEDLEKLWLYDPSIGMYEKKEPYEGDTFNIHYNNKKVVTERTLDIFNKDDKENLNIELPFRPTTKKFRINILDKVNNKNIEITDPALKKNEDGTYELVSYSKKIQDITFNLEGRKVVFKIDISKLPLTAEEEKQIKEDTDKEYTTKDILDMIKNKDSNYLKVKKVKLTLSNLKDRETRIFWDYEMFGPDYEKAIEELNRRNKEGNVNTFDLLSLFPNIEELTIVNNKESRNIVDPNLLNWEVIRKLKHLKKLDLKELYAYENEKTFDFSNIEGIETLEELKIRKEYIYNMRKEYNVVNLEKIATLKNLKVLEMSDLNITDISPLSNLTNLKEIDLSYNNIENIDALKGMSNLEKLYLIENKISNIDSLKEKEKLEVLNVKSNKITDINVVANSKRLKELDISNNDVEDIDVLRNFEKLNILRIIDNPKIRNVEGLKESLKENKNASIIVLYGNNSISDSDIVDLAKTNLRLYMLAEKTNHITYKPKKNKFDIDLLQNGKKIVLSDSIFFRNSGLIKNEDGTYSFKDYKNSEIVRLMVGNLPRRVHGYEYSNDVLNGDYIPYYYVYIDPSDIREEDKVVPTPEKKEENPKEENKVEEKISEIHEKPELIIPQAKLPYAGMQDDTMLKVVLVLTSMYTIASFNLYKKGLEKKNNNNK